MSAVEKIEAAIQKLEGLQTERAYFQHGEWLAANVNECTCAGGTAESNGMHEPGCGTEPVTNDELIVTLHRTIDAQLAILRRQYDFGVTYGWPEWPFQERLDVLALADAILGEVAS